MLGGEIGARLLGVLCGVFLALVVIPPRSRRGFFQRSSAGVVVGWVSTPYTIEYFNMRYTDDNIMLAACGMSYVSWWLLGGVRRIAEKIGSKEES
jgi:hypothetical protein